MEFRHRKTFYSFIEAENLLNDVAYKLPNLEQPLLTPYDPLYILTDPTPPVTKWRTTYVLDSEQSFLMEQTRLAIACWEIYKIIQQPFWD